jgi:TatD DNase family protein
MFDTHIHLNDEQFNENLDSYIEEGIKNGVTNFLVIGFDYASSKRAIEIAHKYECCYAAVGFHPCDVNKIKNIKDLRSFLKLFDEEKVICLGEIGLDYYWVKDQIERERQKEMFIYQLNLAKKKNLPTSIHVREATQDALDILKEHAKTTFIMHCFNASEEILNEYLKLDCYFAIGGVVTFKNAENLQEIVKKIPLDRLLIETDAPYLSPVPYRGKLNEPKYIRKTLEYIAELRGMSFEELDKITTANARKVLLNEK